MATRLVIMGCTAGSVAVMAININQTFESIILQHTQPSGRPLGLRLLTDCSSPDGKYNHIQVGKRTSLLTSGSVHVSAAHIGKRESSASEKSCFFFFFAATVLLRRPRPLTFILVEKIHIPATHWLCWSHNSGLSVTHY